jgi:uncharacterized repeat protein (TIGR01451 family)
MRSSLPAGSPPAAFVPASTPGRSAATLAPARLTVVSVVLAGAVLGLSAPHATGHHPPPAPGEPLPYCPPEQPTDAKKPPKEKSPPPPQLVPPPVPPPAPPAPPPARPPAPAPTLAIAKSGPARLVAGGRGRFIVRVSNRGTGTARGVAVSDLLPPGFFVRRVEIGARPRAWRRVGVRMARGRLLIPIGTLRPGRRVLVRITLGAHRGVRGRTCNYARVSARNAPRRVARACTRVVPPPPRRKMPPRVTG